jgi:hypothetical protein
VPEISHALVRGGPRATPCPHHRRRMARVRCSQQWNHIVKQRLMWHSPVPGAAPAEPTVDFVVSFAIFLYFFSFVILFVMAILYGHLCDCPHWHTVYTSYGRKAPSLHACTDLSTSDWQFASRTRAALHGCALERDETHTSSLWKREHRWHRSTIGFVVSYRPPAGCECGDGFVRDTRTNHCVMKAKCHHPAAAKPLAHLPHPKRKHCALCA